MTPVTEVPVKTYHYRDKLRFATKSRGGHYIEFFVFDGVVLVAMRGVSMVAGFHDRYLGAAQERPEIKHLVRHIQGCPRASEDDGPREVTRICIDSRDLPEVWDYLKRKDSYKVTDDSLAWLQRQAAEILFKTPGPVKTDQLSLPATINGHLEVDTTMAPKSETPEVPNTPAKLKSPRSGEGLTRVALQDAEYKGILFKFGVLDEGPAVSLSGVAEAGDRSRNYFTKGDISACVNTREYHRKVVGNGKKGFGVISMVLAKDLDHLLTGTGLKIDEGCRQWIDRNFELVAKGIYAESVFVIDYVFELPPEQPETQSETSEEDMTTPTTMLGEKPWTSTVVNTNLEPVTEPTVVDAVYTQPSAPEKTQFNLWDHILGFFGLQRKA